LDRLGDPLKCNLMHEYRDIVEPWHAWPSDENEKRRVNHPATIRRRFKRTLPKSPTGRLPGSADTPARYMSNIE
jgi:hypothetical protein